MSSNDFRRPCPACRKGELIPATRQRRFSPLGKEVIIDLLTSNCDACGAQMTNGLQHDENLRRLRARKKHYGHLLMGEEIVAFRMKYGLTQKAAAKVFGKGKIAFSRYENEASYPDQTMTKLLKQAIAQPHVLKALADEEGVEIPLWEARQEDARMQEGLRLAKQWTTQVVDAIWNRPPVGSSERYLLKGVASTSSVREVVFHSDSAIAASNNDEVLDEAMVA